MASLTSSKLGLEKIKLARKAKGWSIDDEKWLRCAAKFLPVDKFGNESLPGSVSLSTWKRFLRGKPIKASNYHAFCKVLDINWLEVVDNANKYLDTKSKTISEIDPRVFTQISIKMAPNISRLRFYGRIEEKQKIEKWLFEDNYKLISVFGMGGVGKSTLIARLLNDNFIKTEKYSINSNKKGKKFEFIIWRSLLNPLPLEEILTDILKSFINQETIYLERSLGNKLEQLIYLFNKYSCLLILDNFDSILADKKSNIDYIYEYSNYKDLLQIISESNHKSCLILTSREKSIDIDILEAKNYLIKSIYLGGLHINEAESLIANSKNIVGSSNDILRIAKYYKGNPLSLNIVSQYIDEMFDGYISLFLKESNLIFTDLKYLLNLYFNRLSEQEKELLYWLAIHREYISIGELKKDIFLKNESDLVVENLRNLNKRFLLERNIVGYTLQPVLLDFVTENLIQNIYQDIIDEKFLLINKIAIVKANTKQYIREAQVRSLLHPLKQQLIESIGRNKLIDTLLSLLRKLRKQQHPALGYASGNILNFLCDLKLDIDGLDLSSLTIWQAYLQNMYLRNVNFENSNLSNSVFTQAFTSVTSVAYSFDGEYFAMGDSKGEIHIWRTIDNEHTKILKGHEGWVWAIEFSSDNQTLASCSADSTVRIWDFKNRKCTHIFREHNDEVYTISYSPDGKYLASSGRDRIVNIYNLDICEYIFSLEKHIDWVWSIKYSPNGKLLATASYDKTINLWNPITGEFLRTIGEHERRIWSISFSPDSQLLASGNGDHNIYLWDVVSGEKLSAFIGHTDRVRSVLFSPDGTKIFSASEDKTIRIWKRSSAECLSILHGHTNWIRDIDCSKTSNVLASGSSDQTIRFWDINSGKCIQKIKGYNNIIYSLSFSPNGKLFASGSEDCKVRIWDFKQGICRLILIGHTNRIWSVKFNSKNTLVATTSADRTIRFWDLNNGSCIKQIYGHEKCIRTGSFNKDDNFFASGSEDHSIKVWDIKSGECIHNFIDHTDSVNSVVFSQNGELIVSASGDGTIKFFSLRTNDCIDTLRGHSSGVLCVDWACNNQFIASGSEDNTARLWNINDKSCIKVLEGHRSWIWSIAISKDSRYLATGSEDHTIRIWSLSTFKCLHILKGHKSRVNSVAFNSSSLNLVSASEDESIKIWNLESGCCTNTINISPPYEGMNITNVKGLSETQIEMLRTLGAIVKGV